MIVTPDNQHTFTVFQLVDFYSARVKAGNINSRETLENVIHSELAVISRGEVRNLAKIGMVTRRVGQLFD